MRSLDQDNGGLDDSTLDAMISAAAKTIRLDIPAEHAVGVRDNLRALLDVARTLIEAERPALPVTEIAPVYRA